MAKDHGEAALATLAAIQADVNQPASARVAAATAILDRGYGKPRQALDLSNPDGSLAPAALDASKLSVGALRELANAFAAPDADGG